MKPAITFYPNLAMPGVDKMPTLYHTPTCKLNLGNYNTELEFKQGIHINFEKYMTHKGHY